MQKDLTVQKFHRAFEGEFNPGFVKGSSPRKSDCFVIYLYGCADYIFHDKTLKISAGDTFFIAKNSVYAIDIKEKSKYICIDFDFSVSDTTPTCFSVKHAGMAVSKIFHNTLKLYLSADDSVFPKLMSLVYEIYYEILKIQCNTYTSKHGMDKITEFILDNYTLPELSPRLLSEKVGISESRIRRLFKSSLYVTPVKYINLLRLEKAKILLTDSNLSVSEISSSVGFEDQFYFSRVFKAQFGVSPIKYRIISVTQPDG